MTTTPLTAIANDWLSNNFDNFDGDWDAYMADMQASFERNASRIGDCFVDTSSWSEGEEFSREELEREIVRIVMTYAAV